MREKPKTLRGLDSLSEVKPAVEERHQQRQMQQGSRDKPEQDNGAPKPQEEALEVPTKIKERLLAEEFDKRASVEGADPREILNKEVLKDASDEERAKVIEEIKALGWNVEIEDEPEAKEPASPKTIQEMRSKYGDPAGNVDGISYWTLSDGRAVMLSGGPEDNKWEVMWGQGGYQKIKSAYYEYRDGAFRKMSDDEVERRKNAAIEIERLARTAREKEPADGSKKEGPRNETKKEKVEKNESDIDNSPNAHEGEEITRTLDQAKKLFARAYHKEKKKPGKAFREAIVGISEKNRRRLIDYIADTTDIPRALLDGIHNHVEHERKKHEESKEKNLHAHIDRDVDALFDGKTLVETIPVTVSFEESIDKEVDALFAAANSKSRKRT